MVINGIISEKNARTRNNKINRAGYTRSSDRSIYNNSNREKIMKIDHQIIITFDKGENCSCCNEKFDKDTTIIKSFNSINEAMAFQKVINRTKELKTRYQQLIGKK
jgi:hypothetical protein